MSQPVYVLYSGQFYSAEEPIFTHHNRSFKYGDGVFETLRVTNGKVRLVEKHFQRLKDSAEFLKIKLPKGFNKNVFEKKILEAAEKNQVSDKARVRFSLFRNDGGYYEPVSNEGQYLIEAEPYPRKGYPLNKKGLKTDLFTTVEKPIGLYSNLKSCNSLPFVMAALHKQEKNLDNVLITNTKNRLAEAISSNLFLVKDQKVLTPPLSEGCVAGVMRDTVLDVMANNEVAFEETPITLEELFTANEVFLTDTINGIRWVANYKIKEYDLNLTREISGMLEKELEKH